MNIGFISLGVMGRPVAGHIIKVSHRVSLASRSGVPSGMVKGEVIPRENAAEVAKHSDVIITVVPDTDDVEAVLFDPSGVGEAANPTVPAATIIQPWFVPSNCSPHMR